MSSRYFTDGEGTVLDRDGGSTLPEVVVECGDMALAERIAAALELQNDIETLKEYGKWAYIHHVYHEVQSIRDGEMVSFQGGAFTDALHRTAEWVRAQQESHAS